MWFFSKNKSKPNKKTNHKDINEGRNISQSKTNLDDEIQNLEDIVLMRRNLVKTYSINETL